MPQVFEQVRCPREDPLSMNISDSYLDAVKSLGYTETEARFVYIAATHSGYFTAAQFRSFTGVLTGKRSFLFTQKVIAKRHATVNLYAQNTRVYHLFSRKVYSAIGKDNIRNRREHEFSFIKVRLISLDYIWANQGHDYFETEEQKVRYFTEGLGLSKECLPTKRYFGQKTPSITARYFVDKFPMFRSQHRLSPPVVSFTYVAADAETLAGFVTHLKNYLPLFRQLKQFHFAFISTRAGQFSQARKIFAELVQDPLCLPTAEELLRYFRIRRAWEARHFATLRNEDVAFLHDATIKFRAERFQSLYRNWKAGTLSESGIGTSFASQETTGEGDFDTYLVKPQGFVSYLKRFDE
jgi:hypothetical protein